MPGIISKIDREKLFHEICNTILQWPELERRVFSQAHYHKQPVEAIACSLQLDVKEAGTILKDCNRRLNEAIKNFRENSCGEPLHFPIEATCMDACGFELHTAHVIACKAKHVLHASQVPLNR